MRVLVAVVLACLVPHPALAAYDFGSNKSTVTVEGQPEGWTTTDTLLVVGGAVLVSGIIGLVIYGTRASRPQSDEMPATGNTVAPVLTYTPEPRPVKARATKPPACPATCRATAEMCTGSCVSQFQEQNPGVLQSCMTQCRSGFSLCLGTCN